MFGKYVFVVGDGLIDSWMLDIPSALQSICVLELLPGCEELTDKHKQSIQQKNWKDTQSLHSI